jgi:DNA repair protein RadC
MQSLSLGSQPVETLSDVDLLAKLLGFRKSRRLFCGSFRDLFGTRDDAATEKCSVAREFVRRLLNEELRRDCVLTQPGAVRDILRLHFASQEFESFVCLFLDAQNRLIVAAELFRGTLTQTSVYPREVVKAALRFNAASLILAHNHPSGVAEPSIQDQALTRALVDALSLVDVKVLDHFVVAGRNALSFAERGLL